MRVFPDWIKTTLKEDKEFYRALLEATMAGPNEDQRRILALVKHHHHDYNRDLTSQLYEQFLTVLDELDIGPPDRKLNSHNQEAGSWYAIPGQGKTYQGATKHERLASRISKRQRFWRELVDESDYSCGELDALLAMKDSQLHDLLQCLGEELDDFEASFQEQIKTINSRIEKLEKLLHQT